MLVALSRSAVRAGLAVGGAGRCPGARRRRRPATGTWAGRMARNRCAWTRGESCGPDDLARRCSQVAEGAAAASERDQPTSYQRRPHTDHRSDRSASAARTGPGRRRRAMRGTRARTGRFGRTTGSCSDAFMAAWTSRGSSRFPVTPEAIVPSGACERSRGRRSHSVSWSGGRCLRPPPALQQQFASLAIPPATWMCHQCRSRRRLPTLMCQPCSPANNGSTSMFHLGPDHEHRRAIDVARRAVLRAVRRSR